MSRPFVIVRLPWISEVKYHVVFDKVPLRKLITFLMATPSFYSLELKLELAFLDLEQLYAISPPKEFSKLLQHLMDEINNSVISHGVYRDSYIFYEWLDSESIVLSETKRSFEWL